ncbi:tau 95 subunit of transcription factor TFIIIC [Aspergillus puulaauensis]|uniref:Tau 95 subunit of transcription factor TFIIIC n=1 Tax=Aspergillus puulaauensis TaxID=1220207 RepID=A0A7R7XWH0_9EURO|nr:tau 95 subunit of transcription factor TFIIIC [Aspergillus puulaauensis]BCS28985.1 tau 95 subunit of transcription factor TFIIIC [Aspergillus puulaauensis]
MPPRIPNKTSQVAKRQDGDADFHQSRRNMRDTSVLKTQESDGNETSRWAENGPAAGEMQSLKEEKRNSDGAEFAVYGKDIAFTGTIVSMGRKTVPQRTNLIKAKHRIDSRLGVTAHEIQQLLHHRPVVTVRVLLDWMGSVSRADIERALPLCGYMFKDGPWKKALIKFGVDPRSSPEFRHYQTVTMEMDFDPIVERGKHDRTKSGELVFPQFLKGDDNIPHVFGGTKFVPDNNAWQICDISDSLLRRIVSTNDVCSGVDHMDGFFWNGTMAKLEVIMRDKLVCIRDGGTPNDADYECLLSFPDKYKPPTGRDYDRYGLDFGEKYTQKQVYLRGQIVRRARRSAP